MLSVIKFSLFMLMALMVLPTSAKSIEDGKRFRALIIGIDGLKGVPFYERAFLENGAPNLKLIALHGQYTRCGKVDDPYCAHAHSMPRFDSNYAWVTASGWASVLTGVNSDKHLVKNNDFQSQADFYQTSKQFPTFLSQLKQKGLITAVGGVGNFLSSMNGANGRFHLSIGVTDFECGVNAANQSASVEANAQTSCNVDYRQSLNGSDPLRDEKLTAWLLQMINYNGDKSPDVIMGVYDTVDGAGHYYGFSSNPGYMSAISRVDKDVGALIQAIQRRVSLYNEAWLVVMTSDHGGHLNSDGSGSHHKQPWDDEVVPFVIGVFGKNITLVNQGVMNDTHVTQMDVNPSVLNWFGLQSKGSAIIRSQYSVAGH